MQINLGRQIVGYRKPQISFIEVVTCSVASIQAQTERRYRFRPKERFIQTVRQVSFQVKRQVYTQSHMFMIKQRQVCVNENLDQTSDRLGFRNRHNKGMEM